MGEFNEQLESVEISQEEIQQEIKDLKKFYPGGGFGTFDEEYSDEEGKRFAELRIKSRKGGLSTEESNELMKLNEKHYTISEEKRPEFL